MKPAFSLSPLLATTLATVLAGSVALAADWPNYRGPKHDGISTEKLAQRTWPASGPQADWRTPATGGFSSVVVADGRAYTLVTRDTDGVKHETLVALDAASGKELWSAALSTVKYDGGGDAGTEDNKGGDGARSTPTVSGGHVYVLDAKLVLACYEAKSGKEVWRKDLMAEHAGRNISWQNAASPVIDGDLVFVAGGGAGQSLLGIDKKSGKTVWKGEDDKMTHATPVVAELAGQRQVIFFTQSGLVAVNPPDGKVLWRQAYRYNISTAASPVVCGPDLVYCSAGYGVGAGLYRVAKEGGEFKVTEVWRQAGKLQNHWSTPVYHDGHLYGLFGFKEYGACPLKCIEVATGQEKWSKPGFGPGNVTLADGHLIVLGDAGQLVLVEATPAAYRETARADVLAGKCWTTPTLSGGKIYARSTQEAVCLDLARKLAAR